MPLDGDDESRADSDQDSDSSDDRSESVSLASSTASGQGKGSRAAYKKSWRTKIKDKGQSAPAMRFESEEKVEARIQSCALPAGRRFATDAKAKVDARKLPREKRSNLLQKWGVLTVKEDDPNELVGWCPMPCSPSALRACC